MLVSNKKEKRSAAFPWREWEKIFPSLFNTHSFPTPQMGFTVARYLYLQVIRELGSSDVHYHNPSCAHCLQEHRNVPVLFVRVFVNWKTYLTCDGEAKSPIGFYVSLSWDLFRCMRQLLPVSTSLWSTTVKRQSLLCEQDVRHFLFP